MQDNLGASVPDQALVSDQASVPCPDPSGFDPSRWMDLYCGLANARHALEFWEREYAVAAARGDSC